MQPKKRDVSLLEQFMRPTGFQGRIVAASMNRGHSNLSNWGLRKAKIGSNFVILDVGCGGGKNISRMADLAFKGKVYGIDYSKTMVKYSRETNKKLITQNRVEVIHSSVEKICFLENFFDLVTAIETYYFWPNLLDTFREINRILKPTSSLIIINEMIKDGYYEMKNAELIEKTHVHLLKLDKIQYLLESAGFENIKIFTTNKSPWNAILAQKQ